MDRNWLIRTSQDQILGPVAKSKLLEFVQKGALGLTDEVSSGNGYWFSIKEKDLVDKYLYGDVPQSYNPISESKSVLFKRDNPEKTTSINSAAANRAHIIKSNNINEIAPIEEDLAFPDITIVHQLPEGFSLASSSQVSSEESKLPNVDDLEFPDVEAVLENCKNENMPFIYPGSPSPSINEGTIMISNVQLGASSVKASLKVNQNLDEVVKLPTEDDLAFPEMDDRKTSTKIAKGKVDLSHQYTRTVALDVEQASSILPEIQEFDSDEDGFGDFTLVLDLNLKDKMEISVEPEHLAEVEVEKKKEKLIQDDRKLLHNRKTKSSLASAVLLTNGKTAKSPASLRDPNREVVHSNTQTEPLKKRNDNYLFFILIIVLMIIVAVLFYFKEILNKPLPV